MIHVTKLAVRSYECDAYGHVNNANYLHYLEVARGELLHAMGLDYRGLIAAGYGLYVTKVCIEYKSPAFMEDELDHRIRDRHVPEAERPDAPGRAPGRHGAGRGGPGLGLREQRRTPDEDALRVRPYPPDRGGGRLGRGPSFVTPWPGIVAPDPGAPAGGSAPPSFPQPPSSGSSSPSPRASEGPASRPGLGVRLSPLGAVLVPSPHRASRGPPGVPAGRRGRIGPGAPVRGWLRPFRGAHGLQRYGGLPWQLPGRAPRFSGRRTRPGGQRLHLPGLHDLLTSSSRSSLPPGRGDALTLGFGILRQWVSELRFDPAEVEREKGVIRAEMREYDTPEDRLASREEEAVYGGTPLADRGILGTPDSVEGASAEDLRAFYLREYLPGRMALIAGGPFERRRLGGPWSSPSRTSAAGADPSAPRPSSGPIRPGARPSSWSPTGAGPGPSFAWLSGSPPGHFGRYPPGKGSTGHASRSVSWPAASGPWGPIRRCRGSSWVRNGGRIVSGSGCGGSPFPVRPVREAETLRTLGREFGALQSKGAGRRKRRSRPGRSA
ncbi:MAG: thioesterase family protein [Candidatus Moduliflexus flocculans]|nr:thioesterase family protein [Candidatus Moduliflexus flocculans]